MNNVIQFKPNQCEKERDELETIMWSVDHLHYSPGLEEDAHARWLLMNIALNAKSETASRKAIKVLDQHAFVIDRRKYCFEDKLRITGVDLNDRGRTFFVLTEAGHTVAVSKSALDIWGINDDDIVGTHYRRRCPNIKDRRIADIGFMDTFGHKRCFVTKDVRLGGVIMRATAKAIQLQINGVKFVISEQNIHPWNGAMNAA